MNNNMFLHLRTVFIWRSYAHDPGPSDGFWIVGDWRLPRWHSLEFLDVAVGR